MHWVHQLVTGDRLLECLIVLLPLSLAAISLARPGLRKVVAVVVLAVASVAGSAALSSSATRAGVEQTRYGFPHYFAYTDRADEAADGPTVVTRYVALDLAFWGSIWGLLLAIRGPGRRRRAPKLPGSTVRAWDSSIARA